MSDGSAPQAEKYDRLANEDWLRKKNHEDGWSVTEIAEECGCSQANVSLWFKKHGIDVIITQKDHRLADEDWLRKKNHKDGWTLTEISEECGCSEANVSLWFKKHNITVHHHRPSAEGVENIDNKYGAGWTDTKRQRVRERDGYECVSCGTTQDEHNAKYGHSLHVHHLIKAREIDSPEKRNAVSNLVTLCLDCHHEWERLSEAGIRPQIDGVTAD